MPRAKSKTTAKKTSRRSATPSQVRNARTVASKNSEVQKPSMISKKGLIIGIIVVVIVAILLIFRNQFVVAEVNGQPITRLELIRQLEKKDGKSVLANLVTEKVILQEANKRRIVVTSSEIDKQVAEIENSIKSSGQNLDLLLAQQGVTRSDLRDQVRLQLTLKKMVGDVKVTDKEVNDYIEQNKASIPEGTDSAQIAKQARTQLEQQKLNEKIQAFVADLQKKAKINYLLNF